MIIHTKAVGCMTLVASLIWCVYVMPVIQKKGMRARRTKMMGTDLLCRSGMFSAENFV